MRDASNLTNVLHKYWSLISVSVCFFSKKQDYESNKDFSVDDSNSMQLVFLGIRFMSIKFISVNTFVSLKCE